MSDFSKNYIPKISIITVVLNDPSGLKETIKSIKSQSYNNFEYIIIDGQSDPETISVINKFQDNINYLVSTPDEGIYDAMNKGLNIANGEWINFMNAGHQFVDKNIIKNIFSNKYVDNYQVIYGELYYQFSFGKIKKECRDLTELWKGMSFSHQSTFVKTELYKNNLFDLNYKFASDFNFFYNINNSGYKFLRVKIPISERAIYGNSYKHMVKSTIERYKIVLKTNHSFKIHIFYQFLIIKYLIRKVISKKLVNNYYKIRYGS